MDNNNNTFTTIDPIIHAITGNPEIKPFIRNYALGLAIIPLMTIFGNALVMLAVYRERSLQTVTNYLIVSLAVSDFLVSLFWNFTHAMEVII